MPRKVVRKAAAPARDWLPVSVKLPRQLVEQIDALAGREERPRSKVIEFACREYVQAHQRRPAAA